MAETTSVTPEHEKTGGGSPAGSPPVRQWLVPTWFLLGILVGVIGFAAYSRLTATPPAATPDIVALRAAAREGTLDAIATLQAGGSPAESRATSMPAVATTAFAIRLANQAGAPDAPVTIIEFGDFQ